MNIGVYDPYLTTLGGGERYILSLGSCLSREHSVTLFWDDTTILKKASDKFNLSLENVKLSSNIFTSKYSFFQRIQKTRQYDAIFVISDGSVPLLGCKKLFLIYQFYQASFKPSVLSKLKMKRLDGILCYSQYVKKDLDTILPLHSTVLYPPVNPMPTTHGTKKKRILSVGRFTQGKNTKKQEIMIESFKELCDRGLTDWELHLAGSYLPQDKEIIAQLKKKIQSYPIFLHENVSYDNLKNLYSTSRIYWHAAGFGENLSEFPERAEHFGISTVEAMSAGCVPVVIKAGGQPEIVIEGENGFLWTTIDELENKTKKLVSDEALWKRLSENAQKQASRFSFEKFCKQVSSLL